MAMLSSIVLSALLLILLLALGGYIDNGYEIWWWSADWGMLGLMREYGA